MNDTSQIAQIADIFNQKDNFLILTHINPDGDALGSVFALLNILKKKNKSVDLYIQGKLPNIYSDIFSDDYLCDENLNIQKYDYYIFLDTSNVKRIALPANLEFDNIDKTTINIDHHIDNSNFAKINYIQTFAACAEIIFEISNELKINISAQIATYIMTGIIADTGCFRFNNTNSKTMTIAARLLEKKADYQKIIVNSFFSKPIELLKLEADLIHNSLKTDCKGKFAWCYLESSLLKKYNLDIKNVDGIIDTIRAIKGVEVALLIYRQKDFFKLSFRSKNPEISVGKIARALNGGGHELAAGATLKVDTIEEVMKKVKPLLQTHFI